MHFPVALWLWHMFDNTGKMPYCTTLAFILFSSTSLCFSSQSVALSPGQLPIILVEFVSGNLALCGFVYAVVRHELAKISSTILFQSGRNFNHWTDVSFWRDTQLPWYLFIHQRLSNLHFFYCTISTVYFNDSNMDQFRCEQNVTDEYNFTSFFPLMKK